MRPEQYVKELGKLNFENTFNPYSNRCAVHDLDHAPHCRAQMLQSMLEAATEQEIDSLWIGRDLGHRGGRRTGLALTDDVHIHVHAKRWGLSIDRPTRGEVVIERTAAVIWRVLSQVEASVFLWNVFPLHPHGPDNPFSNRPHNPWERRTGEEFLFQLILLLKPNRLIAIGNDAMQTALRLYARHKVFQVRHPSYGGQKQFLAQMSKLYNLHESFTWHAQISSVSLACQRYSSNNLIQYK